MWRVYISLLLTPLPTLAQWNTPFLSYDFIIVGSGSAGSVLANRLSEISHWKILLLEAGPPENFITDIPMLVSMNQLTVYNWGYLMEEQPGVALACRGNRMPWPRGRALGGTTVINYMIYTRGSKYFYDEWGEENPGWSYDDVLPYFKKSENAQLENEDREYHGYDGPLTLTMAYQTKISSAFIDGLHEMGLPTIDYNSNESIGVSRVHATVDEGRRNSVAKAFLAPAILRTNLHILSGAFVTKILINPRNSQAYGVEYDFYGRKLRAVAKKEVILSAGSFSSAQLLMLSGIGPQHHLQELGVPLVRNLPVGQNLQDHLAYLGLLFHTDQDATIKFSEVFHPTSIVNYLTKGEGLLTSIGGVQAIAYYNTKNSTDKPNMELLFMGGSLATDYGLFIRQGMNIKDSVYNALFVPYFNKNTFMVWPILLSPKSKGYMKLRSINPYDHPLFYGNFFTDPQNEDLDAFLSAIRFVQKLGQTEAFRKFNATFSTLRDPECVQFKYDSDDYWKCGVRSLGQTLHHQVGTVKMGPRDDPGAVVDNELRVYGVKSLRVADCSVIPFALGAHTNAPAIMVGEKAADLIKSAWGG